MPTHLVHHLPFFGPDDAGGHPGIGWTRGIGEPLDAPGRLEPGHEWQIDDGYWQGLPLGGLGSGSIGRTYRGDFARWHLEPGRHHYEPLLANQMALWVRDRSGQRATVLCAARPSRALSAWSWTYPPGRGRYHALFPRAWYFYDPDVLGLRLAVRQFSPVLPRNYRESSYPVGVFVAVVENPRDDPVEAAILLTWQNLVGWSLGRRVHRNLANRLVEERAGGLRIAGVVLGMERHEVERPWDGQFCIAAREDADVRVSARARFVANGDGADLWQDFVADGRLDDAEDPRPPGEGEEIGAAVAVSLTLPPRERREVPLALAWDLPIMQFGPNSQGRRWYRRYTAFYGTGGTSAWRIARDALEQWPAWEADIEAWQRPVLEDPDLPAWYKGALFNELYYVVDGGSVWENGQVGAPGASQGRFSLLECFDYPFYGTLDVRFYGSFAVLMLWPELEKQELLEFAAAVPQEDRSPVRIEATGRLAPRKVAGVAPHDLGSPDEDPWIRPNAYRFQDTTIWKDLNSKFVLQVYRDARILDDWRLARACWPAVVQAMERLSAMDRDGDGLIENEGQPDQTYDTWPMFGPSAYCGGLWLAALRAAADMARRLGHDDLAARYDATYRRALASYEATLWNGQYYRFDARGPSRETIMADQVAGAWYAATVGLGDILPRDHVRRALQHVFAFNVRRFQGGTMGAVNGMRPDGTVDDASDQSQEVWPGVTYAVAAHLLLLGLADEAWTTARGAYDVTYRTRGYWFRTPEAWNARGDFRASMYLRPLSIWALQLAHERHRPPPNDRGP